ncbi:hypothetical protein DID74_00865 [Candidatus Marinamargulisbacteria bacterium SCGC AG-333-B06]|nr:hypothetical protein DID74_00865 [Candidatus Marinamargulisbacteria bacterium SCGC AG-333-B06]
MIKTVTQFKDSTLIIVVAYRFPEVITYSLKNILEIIQDQDNTWVVVINNAQDQDIIECIDSLKHPKLITFQLPFNFGKALAANFFCNHYITKENIPKTIVSLDPDTIFSRDSFNTLVEASHQLPQCGMIGMRFKKNKANPERNLFFKPKKCVGINKKEYYLSCPFMCTVAGPILAIQGKKIVEDCNNQLFPKKYIQVYGGDDSALYNMFRWKYVNGYLEGTEATHLVSAGQMAEECIDLHISI